MMEDIKKLKFIFMFIFFVFSFTSQSFAIDIYYKNNLLDTDVEPLIENGRALVPIYIIANNMDADIKWNLNKKLITIIKQNRKVHIEIGNYNMLVETNTKNQIIQLDTPATIFKDRTMIPIRAISEIFGSDVKWDEQTCSILIDSDKNIVLKKIKSKNKNPKPNNVNKSINMIDELILIKSLNDLPRVNYKIPELKVKIEDVSLNKRYIEQINLLNKKFPGNYKAYNISSIKNPNYSLISYMNTYNHKVYIQEKSNDNMRDLAIYSMPNYTVITSPDFNYEIEAVIRSLLMKGNKISKDDDLLIEQKSVSKNNSYIIQTLRVTMEDSTGSHYIGDYLIDVSNNTIVDFKTKKIIFSDNDKNN